MLVSGVDIALTNKPCELMNDVDVINQRHAHNSMTTATPQRLEDSAAELAGIPDASDRCYIYIL